jgi:tRNA(Ile)-lysidine synthase
MFSPDFLEKKCLLKPDDLVVVGVSGGADSLYLLNHLHQIGQPLIAAVFNHKLRPQSDAEVCFVSEICTVWGIPCVTGFADVLKLSQIRKISLEEAARIARYEFLFQTARNHRAAAVATAHHADDQVETILMHFLRGSGLDGLTGMLPRIFMQQWDPDEQIPLIRPILDIRRYEIEEWCRAAGIEPVQDASNNDIEFFRNRLRHVLIPDLEQNYNPKFRQHLLNLSHTVSEDKEIIEAVIEESWKTCVTAENDNNSSVVFDRIKFLSILPGIQARLVRKVKFRLCPDSRDVSFDSIMRVLDFITGIRINDLQPWENKLWMAVEDDKILFYQTGMRPNFRNYPQLPDGFLFHLSVPGQVLFYNRSVDCDLCRLSPPDYENFVKQMKQNRFFVCLDLNRITQPLIIRTGTEGEIFRPLGSGGHRQKLSDFWINNKVPYEYRRNYPLVADQNEIIWIPGFRPAEFCKLTRNTTNGILLKMDSVQS